jgi:hypothetical protein
MLSDPKTNVANDFPTEALLQFSQDVDLEEPPIPLDTASPPMKAGLPDETDSLKNFF